LIWRRGFNLWHILVVVLNGLLLWGIGQIWWGEGVVPAASRAGKGPALPKIPALRDQQPLSAFRVVSAKDLFSQGRTGPEAGKNAKALATLEGRQLVGTMLIGAEKAALISSKPSRGQSAGQVDVVRQGEDYEGFKVVEIFSDSVVFQGKDGKKTLNFPE